LKFEIQSPSARQPPGALPVILRREDAEGPVTLRNGTGPSPSTRLRGCEKIARAVEKWE